MKNFIKWPIAIALLAVAFMGCFREEPDVLQPTSKDTSAPQFVIGTLALPGDEELVPIDIPLNDGTGIAVGGVGLVGLVADVQPGTIDIDVPGDVVHVFLYWAGHNATEGTDTEVTVNGTPVTGTVVGGPTLFFDGAWSSTVRADITDMGVVSSGANSVAIGGLDFTTICPWACQNLGAGLVVVYNDGSQVANLQIREGNDNAFFDFESPLDTTVPQIFNFAASASDRVAKVSMLAASVAQFPADGGRPNVVEVIVGDVVTRFVDVFTGNSGNDFDAVTIEVDIPAGATSMSVQALSEQDPESDFTGIPASFDWLACAATIPPGDGPPLGSIGDFVWCDLNNDGVQDAGEPGIPGVTVNLVCTLGDNSVVQMTTTTDADGLYLFTDLQPGDCTVSVDPTTAGGKVPGDNCPTEIDVELDAGEDYLDADFCFIYPPRGSIGDFVWCDLNNDGVQDAGEPGIPGVTVNLVCTLGDNTVLQMTTTTDADGMYLFTDLQPGMCTVSVDPTTAGDKVPGDFCPIEQDVMLDEGEVYLDADFCFVYPPECDDCDGKVTELTLKYNGAVGANITVVQKKPETAVFDGFVNAGGTFSFSGVDDKGTLSTEIRVYVNGVLNTKIHTSCSQPIGPGLVSGDFEVISGSSRNGGLLCPVDVPPDGGDECDCDGKVTELTLEYQGASGATVTIVQKKPETTVFDDFVNPGESFSFSGADDKGTLSTEIRVYVDGVLNTKIHTSCSQPIGPGLVSGDFEVLAGRSLKGGELCPVNVPPDGGGGDDCGCEGKVTELTLRYDGNVTGATITVEQKKPETVVFDEIVAPGGSFSFVGVDKNGTLSTEIRVYVNGVLNTEIHTSCSKPIGPGLVSGDFTVITGSSRNIAGPLCPVDE